MEEEDCKYFGICKCCLRDGCFKSMWVNYEVDGVSQNYGEMLNECFDLCVSVFYFFLYSNYIFNLLSRFFWVSTSLTRTHPCLYIITNNSFVCCKLLRRSISSNYNIFHCSAVTSRAS